MKGQNSESTCRHTQDGHF